MDLTSALTKIFGEVNALAIIMLGYVAIKVNKISVDFQTTKDRSNKNERSIETLEQEVQEMEKEITEIKNTIELLKIKEGK